MPRSLVLLLAVLGLCACNKSAPEAPAAPAAPAPVTAPAAPPGPGAGPATLGAAPGKRSYRINVEAPAQTKVGQQAEFRIVLLPAPGYHVNQEFPFEIALDAADVSLGKQKLAKADAQKFSQDEARFAVGFVAKKPGEVAFTAKARFAVCTEKDCWPMRETLTWKTTAN